jgi:transposase
MQQNSAVFVGLDTSKKTISVAVADEGREGEVRFVGDIENTPEAVRRLVTKLTGKHRRLAFCYEAGPTGYGLYRQITALGHECAVSAPSLIPKRPGERVKTDRRDAVTLARLHRAGELTRIWVPDPEHEAVRELVRAREAAMADLRQKRQHLQAFLLRHGRLFPGRKPWTRAHARWLAELSFEHPAQYLVLREYRQAIGDAEARLERLTAQVSEIAAAWSMAPVVAAYQALRGVALLTAVTFVASRASLACTGGRRSTAPLRAEIGDVRRFESPRQLMAYLGLVPSERSTGERVWRGSITKAGNPRARRVLIEGAWTYRFPARMSRLLQARHGGRQAPDGGDHRDRPRDGRLPLGDRLRDRTTPGDLIATAGRPIDHRCCAALGAEPRWGPLERIVWPTGVDARWQIEAAPDEHTVLR